MTPERDLTDEERRAVRSLMCVMHSCDNRRCLNLLHLSIGTNADNVADKVAKGRQQRGETAATAKLAQADVDAIRRMVADGATQHSATVAYGVASTTVSRIVHGRTWAESFTHPGGKLGRPRPRMLTIAGVSRPLREWAADHGLKVETLELRVKRWPEDLWLIPTRTDGRRPAPSEAAR
jgi:hypothetical protein